MCALVNFVSASTKARDAVIRCDDVMTIIANVLVSTYIDCVTCSTITH
jgi:hypothetical protein